ncbi:MAG TPA: terminase [Pseudomonas sp.]|nr:terminase [Pseudomonadales bacterium]HCB41843.1 terminase [Pseudomonas sp.]HCL40553.1 terminase [Pseudomonas sp.]|tara:strand:+ start:1389 stop:2774 length:1386 start_codon:yes stop_codon:yes gene_type:complete
MNIIQPALPLYDYQRRWVNDDSRFKIAMFARQCGKTFTSTLELALDCARAEALGQRRRWVILSRGERQAREAMNEGVKLHLQALSAGFQAYDYDWEPGIKALEVELPGGSKITALPANPDTARGFSANVLLDEFAFHQDSRAIWKALFPVISKPGLKLRVISTPNGKGNKFYDLMTGKDDGWSRHTTDIYQAVADGLPRNIEELRTGAGDADLWAQEFELQWLDESSAWLDFDLITSCEHEFAGLPEHYQRGPCYVGVDIAARNDLFVIWVLERVGDVLWTREIIERRRASFAEQDMLLDDVFRRYNVIRCCMDQTGMGEKPVEDAKRRYGELRLEGVLFTAANKLTLATQGKEHFQDRKLRIPQGNNALRADLHKLQRVTSATGAPRFVADSDSAGHADRTWAGFLAINAAGVEPMVIDYRSSGARAETRQLERYAPGSGGQITSRGWGTVGGNNLFEDY